ncbi:MAG: hypothetical protein ACYSWO_21450 [Planctomycetota bacterium]
MTIKIDPKSLVVGAAVAAVVLMAMGFAARDRDRPTDAAGRGRLTADEVRLLHELTTPEPERFQVESNEVYAVILDTATGQAWRYHLGTRREDQLAAPKIKPADD